MPLHEIKICQKCNAEFECKPGSITQCQCFGIKLTAEQQACIELSFTDCLCIACLTTIQNDADLFKEKFIYK